MLRKTKTLLLINKGILKIFFCVLDKLTVGLDLVPNFLVTKGTVYQDNTKSLVTVEMNKNFYE